MRSNRAHDRLTDNNNNATSTRALGIMIDTAVSVLWACNIRITSIQSSSYSGRQRL